MSDPYIGEIRMFAGTFAPVGWAMCSGQTLAISENEALFNLIGTTYGGDGQTTFGLPDLQGRFPLHTGGAYPLGQQLGVETVTLTTQQIPPHNHLMIANSNNASTANAQGNVLAQTPSYTPYIGGMQGNAPMSNNAVTNDGGSQPHDNMQPYLTVTFIISLEGVYPTPN